MSKLVIAALGGTAAVAAVGVGGVVLGGKGEDRSNFWDGEDVVKLDAKLEFTTLSNFKRKKGGSCVIKSFGEVDFGGAVADSSALTKNDFAGLQSGDPTQGCLIVNWEKINYKANDKWGGGFRWLWSFRRGNSGFVMFVTTKDGSLDLEGVFYILEQKDGKWSIKKHQGVDSGAQVGVAKPEEDLPTVGSALSKTSSKKNIDWKFITTDDTANKFCHSGDSCDKSNSQTKEKAYSWWFSAQNMPASGEDLTAWTANLDTWYSNAFKPSNWKLGEALRNIKGVWKFAG